MMDAKNALVECNGGLEAAFDYLRKKVLAKAAKKSGRTAAEGLVSVASNATNTTAALVEVNAETDFVARNQQFQDYAAKAAQISLTTDGSIEALASAPYEDGKTAQDVLTGLIATIGDNMGLRRSVKLSVNQGYVASYVHNAIAPNLGKIGVLVALESAAPAEKLATLGKQLAMHVAASGPQFLDVASVDPAAIEREKNVQRESRFGLWQTCGYRRENARRPYAQILRRSLPDGTSLHYGSRQQNLCRYRKSGQRGWQRDQTRGYSHYVLGEGIEKEVVDFAAEVASVVNG